MSVVKKCVFKAKHKKLKNKYRYIRTTPELYDARFQKRDFDLLKDLIAESPRIISREEIVKELWKEGGDDVSFSTLNSSFRIVDNSIVRIRGHLREEAKKVRSVRGMGYQWG